MIVTQKAAKVLFIGRLGVESEGMGNGEWGMGKKRRKKKI